MCSCWTYNSLLRVAAALTNLSVVQKSSADTRMSIDFSRCGLRAAGLCKSLWFSTLLNWHIKRAPSWADAYLQCLSYIVLCRALRIKGASLWNDSESNEPIHLMLMHELFLSFLFVGSKSLILVSQFFNTDGTHLG